MKQRALFAGIDGSGKSSSLDQLIDKYKNNYHIIKVVNSDGSLVINGERELVFKRFYNLISFLRPLSKKYNFYSIFLALKYLYKVVVVKYVEHFRKCDLMMYEIDFLLHPAVYVTYHFNWTKKISSRWRFKIFSGLFGSKEKSTIFYLDIDPDEAMRRIHDRGEEIQLHENKKDLTILREEFQKVILAAKNEGYCIHTLSAENSQDEVVAQAEKLLKERLQE